MVFYISVLSCMDVLKLFIKNCKNIFITVKKKFFLALSECFYHVPASPASVSKKYIPNPNTNQKEQRRNRTIIIGLKNLARWE